MPYARYTGFMANIDWERSALLLVDVQNDFCDGALAVPSGGEVISPLNECVRIFSSRLSPVIATQDWHPAGHCSFAEQGGPWPAHCVKGTLGAELHPKLEKDGITLIIRKGFRRDIDSYSAFFENDKETVTGLDGYLRRLGVRAIYAGGLATDYCVFYTLMDAAASGFQTYLIEDAVRGVDLPKGSVEKAIAEMKNAGVRLVSSASLGQY
jgi:nicotinamidase/pyrazinamidase